MGSRMNHAKAAQNSRMLRNGTQGAGISRSPLEGCSHRSYICTPGGGQVEGGPSWMQLFAFKAGQRVRHISRGTGEVLDVKPDSADSPPLVLVSFDNEPDEDCGDWLRGEELRPLAT